MPNVGRGIPPKALEKPAHSTPASSSSPPRKATTPSSTNASTPTLPATHDQHDATPGHATPIATSTSTTPPALQTAGALGSATTTTNPVRPAGPHEGLPDVMLKLGSGMTVAHGS